jgi:murein lipoprotein
VGSKADTWAGCEKRAAAALRLHYLPARPSQEEDFVRRRGSIVPGVALVAVLGAGCATTGDLKDLEGRVSALESRVQAAEQSAQAAQEAAAAATASADRAAREAAASRAAADQAASKAEAIFDKSVRK